MPIHAIGAGASSGTTTAWYGRPSTSTTSETSPTRRAAVMSCGTATERRSVSTVRLPSSETTSISSALMRARWLSMAERSVSWSPSATTCLNAKSPDRIRAAWTSRSLRASSNPVTTLAAVASSALTWARALRSITQFTARSEPIRTTEMRIRKETTSLVWKLRNAIPRGQNTMQGVVRPPP